MADAFTIEFARGDVAALQHQMRRAEKLLGKSSGQSVRFGAWAAAKSLGASTKVSGKYRPYEEKETTRGGVKKFEVTSHKRGGKNTFDWYARGVRELKKGPARIANRGLAKGSWMWGIRALGSGAGAGKDVSAVAKSRSRNKTVVVKSLTGSNPCVRITNRLGYIMDALRGGPQDVSTAMGRAARQMAKIIDAGVAKTVFGK